jgi:hypothetical protein
MAQRHDPAPAQAGLPWPTKLFIGGAGAVVPIGLELLAINYRELFIGVATFQDVLGMVNAGLVMGYALRALVLFVIGGVYVLVTAGDEVNPRKLFQLGIIAPALLTSLNANVVPQSQAPAPKPFVAPTMSLTLIPVAHAQTAQAVAEASTGKSTFGEELLKGLTLRGGSASQPAALAVTNASTYLPDVKSEGRNWWDWTVYLAGPDAELAQVKCVEYMLHPTFDPPKVQVCERGAGALAFPLTRRGWGTFTVKARVQLKDGSERALEHTLVFEPPRQR